MAEAGSGGHRRGDRNMRLLAAVALAIQAYGPPPPAYLTPEAAIHEVAADQEEERLLLAICTVETRCAHWENGWPIVSHVDKKSIGAMQIYPGEREATWNWCGGKAVVETIGGNVDCAIKILRACGGDVGCYHAGPKNRNGSAAKAYRERIRKAK